MSPSDFQAYAQTPSQQAAHQPAPILTTPTAHLNQFLTNMLQVAWYDESPPPLSGVPSHQHDLYFLYTITGLVLIGPWPQYNGFPQEVGDHYCGWAYLTPDQLPLTKECLQ
jgi:hypothetical protein